MIRAAKLAALLALALVVSAHAQDGASGTRDSGPGTREGQTPNPEPRIPAPGSRLPNPGSGVIRVAYVFSDGNLPGTLKAFKSLLQERPDLRGRVALTFLTESVMADVKVDEITRANVLLLDTMNQQMLERFNATHNLDLIAQVRGQRGKVFGIGEGLLPKETYLKQGVIWDERARTYWAHMGYSNQVGLLKYALTEAGVSGLSLPRPQPSLDFGYYYPASSGLRDARASVPREPGQVFATWDEFNTWRQQHGKLRSGAPRIAISFYKATYYSDETELLDAVISHIERSGAEAIPMFGYPGEVAAQRLLLNADGTSRVDAVLGFNFNFSGPDASAALAKVDVPVLNLISLYGRSEREWRESPMGLSMFEGTFNIAVPELAGTIAPTVVGSQEKVTDPETGLTIVVRKPIASQIAMAVQRAVKWAALRSKANADKRVALVFYNYPAGKANIGASYLNVAESLASILQRLKAEGYDVGTADLSGESVLQTLLARARNVGGYAPGELQALVDAGTAIKVGAAQYARWLNGLSPSLKAKVLKDWGNPGMSRLMTSDGSLVIPAVQFGKIALLPQPSRGWGEDSEKLYHAKDLAPHHQYVAAYAWLREGFRADAVVHIGTHGTLEWLDGKDIGLSNDDAPDALIADLPHLYVYNVDVVGEGLVARRRSMAALVDHMVPPFKKGGLYPELAALGESINDFDTSLHKNPELAKAVGERIRQQVIALGLTKDLGLDLSKPESLTDEAVHQIQDHLLELKGENIPYGLHTFGRVPEKPLRDTTVDAIVSVDRSLLPSKAKVLAEEMDRRIVASGTRELESLVRGLRGGFIMGGGGGEPIRNPDSYPTGKNFYGIDPDKVPKPASYDMGVKLADQMLADHVKKHGKYPEKVSFVIWGDETMRHEGVLESQIFHLLGTKPVWDVRGKVVDVEVIPRVKLGRPRVDIVIASAAEGMFNNVTNLMDKAVQEVKAIDEAENFVRNHYLKTKAILVQRGYTELEADRRAGVRIFDEPPGTFNLNTSTIVANSGTWDTDKGMADDYLRKLGHGYGNGFWGESMEDVFRLALSGTEKIVHSSSTMLYGALDNDDMFMYMGGLATAIRNIDGTATGPEMVVTNTRDPGNPEMTSIDKFIGSEFRSRYVNPTWIEGMKKEGYAGAGEMRSFVEYLWGWDATASETVTDGMWKEAFDVYVEDKHKMGMAEFFDKSSPFAYQDITARMLETVRKGYWKADAVTEKRLLEEYVQSVNRHGVGCAEHTCGNPRLQQYVMERGLRAGIPVPDLEGFKREMEKATQEAIDPAAEREEAFSRQNDAQMAARLAAVPAPGRTARQLEGYLMEERDRSTQARNDARADARPNEYMAVIATLPVLGVLLVWRWRRRGHRS